jgi:hypothetical protein
MNGGRHLEKRVSELAFHGQWRALLDLLWNHQDFVNAASEKNGYTPLHQAAWHGADLSVIGELFAIGADRSLRTKNKDQTAHDIAKEKHAHRPDLEYVLTPGKRSLSQMMRKVMADLPDLFEAYDGNRVVCDRLIESLSSDWISYTNEDVEARLDSALRAITGVPLSSSRGITFQVGESFTFKADTQFWRNRFIPSLQSTMSRAHVTPIQEEWAVISDLFDPAPTTWGLRGDLFLWMQMRQTFWCVEIPREPQDLEGLVSAAFALYTGTALARDVTVRVNHLAHGGMSSGMVSGEFWVETFIPLLIQRSQWLQNTWERKTGLMGS